MSPLHAEQEEGSESGWDAVERFEDQHQSSVVTEVCDSGLALVKIRNMIMTRPDLALASDCTSGTGACREAS